MYFVGNKFSTLAKDFITEQLKQRFKDRESFSRDELLDFYRRFEPDLKETTFRWRIYQLKTKNIIRHLSRSEFTLSYKPSFRIALEDSERRVFLKIRKEFTDLKFCVWSTSVLNQFMLHLSDRAIILIEVEKEALSPVFNFLKDEGTKDLYIQPEEKDFDFYISEKKNPLILKTLISKAPLQTIRKITVPTIEKIIVDIFSEPQLFRSFQGSEFHHVVNNIYHKYAIDFTKLFGYALRRGREEDLMDYLSNNTDIPKILLND